MHRIRTLAATVATCALAATAWAGQDKSSRDTSEEAKVIQDAITVLRDLTSGPDRQIPEDLLARAEAVVVIPSLVKGGFIVGAKHGKGVVSARDRATNTWSNPAFVDMTGGSIGWQIGVEAVDLVLLVMNRNGLDELLQDKFTLGGNLSVAAGPVGRAGAAATNAQVSAQILAYSKAKGLFAGATLEGAALRGDESDNKEFYGTSSLREVVNTKPAASAPAAATEWRNALKSLVTMEPKP
jgi:lipid-binding SYLF domain-containing protein